MRKMIKKYTGLNMLKNRINKHIDIRVNALLEERLPGQINKYFWNHSKNTGQQKLIKRIEDKLYLYCYTDSKLAEKIFNEEFEDNELEFFKRYLRTGDAFIDIGANIGLFTILSAKLVGENGSVFSFEPVNATYNRLIENIELNHLQNVKSYQLALSNNDGSFEMMVSKEGYDAWNSMGKPIAGGSFGKEKINTEKFDNIFSMHNHSNISLIKIDVEGWEMNVLKGGRNFFSEKNSPTLMLEFCDKAAENSNSSCATLYEYLNELGYDLFSYESHSNKLIPEKRKEHYSYENLLAIKNFNEVEKRIVSK